MTPTPSEIALSLLALIFAAKDRVAACAVAMLGAVVLEVARFVVDAVWS